MTPLRIGSLFSGYSGLDLAVRAVFPAATTAWVSDNDPGACKILAHRLPDAPNLGDVTAVDWSQVEPVDVMTAGFPCQPVSSAGKQLGLADERWLFGEIVRALGDLDPQPRLLLLENVPRLRTLDRGNVMAAVVHGLASVGFVGRYRLLRASDVWACHKRERIFIAAHPEDVRHEWSGRARAGWTGPADGRRLPTPRARDVKGRNQRNDDTCLTGALLPTPRATDGTKGGPNQRGSGGDLMLPSAVALLPTPAVNDMGRGKTPEDWTGRMKAEHGNGNGHGKSLDIDVQRLLPTPGVADSDGGHHSRSGDRSDELLLKGIAHHDRFGDYAAAIARQEQAFGHPAPDPTEPAPRGGRRLSCRFTEWMMGLPPGWITDVPGITHNETLKAAGNGVVPQQAAAALTWLLAAQERAA